MIPSETHLVSHVAPIVATITCLATLRIGTESASVANIGRMTAVKTLRYARFHTGRALGTRNTSLKLVSTMPIELMTVHTRKPKPIQPNVHTSNFAMRSKSAFVMSRACAANSSAAMRLRSRSSSLTMAIGATASSWACSTLEIITSICSLIFLRA